MCIRDRNMGADDYITKPFTPMELLARVNSHLRRYNRFMEMCIRDSIEGGDNQRLERTGSGLRKPPPESSVPGENLTEGSRRNQLRRGHGLSLIHI